MSAKRLAAAVVLAALPSLAIAAPDHDEALEQAAIRLVAERMGSLRGGFSFDQRPEFNRQEAHNISPRQASGSVWQDGLAPAQELPAITIKLP